MDGLGFQTVDPFHADCIAHYRKHGFAYLGMITIVTDVVRENNQTYRLGWTEQCKDGTRMGVGMPEYLLLFRKPQTDRTRGYADVPVVKAKPLAGCVWSRTGETVEWDDKLVQSDARLRAGAQQRLFAGRAGRTMPPAIGGRARRPGADAPRTWSACRTTRSIACSAAPTPRSTIMSGMSR
jgi:hypothetical protein